MSFEHFKIGGNNTLVFFDTRFYLSQENIFIIYLLTRV